MDQSLKNAFIILFVIGITFFYALYQKKKIVNLYNSDNTPLMVEKLPHFNLKLLGSEKTISSESIHDDGSRFFVVHFWGTWCAPCLPEFPQFLQFAKKFLKDPNVKFLAVAVRDKKGDVEKFIKKLGTLPPNVYLAVDGDGKAMSSFGTVKVPETHYYLQKRSVKRFIGPQEWGRDYFVQSLKSFL